MSRWDDATDKQLAKICYLASRFGGKVYEDARILEPDMLSRAEASEIIEAYYDNRTEEFGRLISAALAKPVDLTQIINHQ